MYLHRLSELSELFEVVVFIVVGTESIVGPLHCSLGVAAETQKKETRDELKNMAINSYWKCHYPN